MNRHPPAWYDAQYNNRARIPEMAAILTRWADDSARARARLRDRVEIAYGDDESEKLDLFPARATAREGAAPILVYLHGGYWRALDKRDQSFVAPPFVEAGVMVVVPNYALCPAVTIEHIALQLVAALAWVYRHAPAYGGDREQIVVAGQPAGGHLAAMLLACEWPSVGADLPRDLVAGALAISGLFELEPLRRAPFLAPDLRLTKASAARLSPARMPAPRGPLVTVVGANESEEYLRQSVSIGRAWGTSTVIGAEVVPGRHHMAVMPEIADPHSRTHQWTLRLLGLNAMA